MNNKISKRDWEAISAYLDGQISERNLARFEARLQREPALRSALNEMDAVRQVLRNAPRLRAPRNFTLTPQMVGQAAYRPPRRKTHLAPFLGWATIAATLLLVFVLIGDFLIVSNAKPVAIAPPSDIVPLQEVALEISPATEAAAPANEVESPPLNAPAAGGYSETQPETSGSAAVLETAAVPETEPAVTAERIFSPAVAPTATPASPQSDVSLSAAADPVTGTTLYPAESAVTGTVALTETAYTADVALATAVTDVPAATTATAAESDAAELPAEGLPAENTAQPTAVLQTPVPTSTPQPAVSLPSPSTSEATSTAAASVPADTNANLAAEDRPGQNSAAETAEKPAFHLLLRDIEIVLLVAIAGMFVSWLFLRRRG